MLMLYDWAFVFCTRGFSAVCRPQNQEKQEEDEKEEEEEQEEEEGVKPAPAGPAVSHTLASALCSHPPTCLQTSLA